MRRFVVLISAPCSVRQPLEKAVVIEQKSTFVSKRTHGSIEMRRASEIQQRSWELFRWINFHIQPSSRVDAAAYFEFRYQFAAFVQFSANCQTA
jgi:hypothetical protein